MSSSRAPLIAIILFALVVSSCGSIEIIQEGPAPSGGSDVVTEENPEGADAESAPEEDNQAAPSTTIAPAEAFFYNLPPAEVTNRTGLYASPNRAEYVSPTEIPVGETIYVMGKNSTASHLRVVWNTGVGWVPVSFTSYNGAAAQLGSLPVFGREPPPCAEPITTQFSLNSQWTSNIRQRVAVVVDLFRGQYGDFPDSYLSLTVNGQEVADTRRQIVERGQFSLKDVVFTLPGYLQEGDTLGYQLDTPSQEQLAFMATLFRVPENCKWDVD